MHNTSSYTDLIGPVIAIPFFLFAILIFLLLILSQVAPDLAEAIVTYYEAIVKQKAKKLKARAAAIRADSALSRTSHLKSLDSRIVKIERQLRVIIAVTAEGDSSQLPPHVNEKIDERLRSEAKKNAAVDLNQYKALLTRLEFSDLRELQDITLSKMLWPKFQPRFENKEALSSKFGQLAGLRNSIRHTRSINEITQKEGEAAIIWFERVLGK